MCSSDLFLSVLPEPADQRLQAVLAHSDAIRNANWGREWYLLRKHGADLFGRAGEEVRAALEQMRADADPSNAAIHKILDINFARHQHIPTFRNWSKSQVESRTLADGDIEAWWNTIQQLEFRSAAYQLFAEAWIGASAPERTDLTVVTPFAEVRQFLHHFHHPCFGE